MQENLNKGEIIIYNSEDGKISLDVRLEKDNIWLTQKAIVKYEIGNYKILNMTKTLKDILCQF